MKAILIGIAFLGFLMWIRAQNNKPPEYFEYREEAPDSVIEIRGQ